MRERDKRALAQQIKGNLGGGGPHPELAEPTHVQVPMSTIQIVRVPYNQEIGKIQMVNCPPGFVLHTAHIEPAPPPSNIIKPGDLAPQPNQRFATLVLQRVNAGMVPRAMMEEQSQAEDEGTERAERRGDVGTLGGLSSFKPREEGPSEPLPQEGDPKKEGE